MAADDRLRLGLSLRLFGEGGEEAVEFGAAPFLFEFVFGVLVAVEGFQFLGDYCEFFEFISRLDGAAEEFPKSLEE